MKLSSFLKLVEIQTKVASLTPFLLGTVYVLYRFDSFNWTNFMLMFISLLSIDMATTSINNYYDYKKAIKTYGFGYEHHNAIVKDKLSEKTVLTSIFTLLGIAVVFGFLLFLNTNIVVLILGFISFMVGILYSFGPIPISRTPFGELFSGGFMGLLITFLSIYIHIFNQNIVTLSYEKSLLVFHLNIIEVLYIFLISIPAIVGISNIMLANNICDMEDDIENKRYTLPIYIGKDNALMLFRTLYYIAYMDLIILLLLNVTPMVSILTLLTFFPVNKNIKTFYKKQSKENTFILAVKNFFLMNIIQILLITLAIIIKFSN